MKKALLLLLLVSISGFSQAEKDSLLAKDILEVHNTLKLMHYLEREVAQSYTMSSEERALIDKTFPYYLKKNIIANNPIPSIDILRYLEIYLKKDIPDDWESFIDKVNNTNARSLLSITEKYGYPSNKRIEKYAGIYDLPNPNIIFSIRKNKYQEEFDTMLKKEIRKGNATQGEYDFFLSLGGGQREAFSNDQLRGKKTTITIELERQ